MSATALLIALRDRHINLTVAGGRLLYDAPKGSMTNERRDQSCEHKGELIEGTDHGDHSSESYSCGILGKIEKPTDLGLTLTVKSLYINKL